MVAPRRPGRALRAVEHTSRPAARAVEGDLRRLLRITALGLLYALARPAALPRGQRQARAAQAPPEFIYPSDAPIDLRDFAPLEEAELAKLEVYCLATCADEMRWFRPPAPVGGAPPRLSPP